jgi:hypothetical protein
MSIEEKVFDVFSKKCTTDFFDLGRGWAAFQAKWEKHLESLGCEVMKTGRIPKSTRGKINIPDPFWTIEYKMPGCVQEGGRDVYPHISIPREVAEKILVLGHLP